MSRQRAGTNYTLWLEHGTSDEYKPSEKAHGFVYVVIDSNDRVYVGKKALKGGSNWRTYATSCYELRNAIMESGESRNTDFRFRVLWECYDEKTLKILEAIEICKWDGLTTGYNSNLAIRQIGKVDTSGAKKLYGC